MTKRIFRSICLIALSLALSSIILVASGLYSYFSKQQQNHLRELTSLASEAVNGMGREYFDELEVSGCRITLIDPEGKVLYDTLFEPAALTNHLQREEIKEAIETGIGESTRYSETLTEYQFYRAEKLDDGSVIRLSFSQSSVLMLIYDAAVPLLIIFLLALGLSFLFAYSLSQKIVKPLNELNLDDPLSNKGYDEVMPLLARIAKQQRQLRRQSEELERRETEFNTITEGMSEGLVLLSQKGIIIGINSAAMKLLSLKDTSRGKDFLLQINNETIRNTVSSALFGNISENVLQLSGSTYSIKADPVITDGHLEGVILLMLDITEKYESENMRKEFTANVSHELKTPLHSISGYAELMAHGMVKSEDVPLFAGKIKEESGRLINLVEDIIRLSHLDEGGSKMEFVPVDLLTSARAVLRNLQISAKERNVNLEIKGENLIINAVPTLLSEIIYNLTDNAIKYNKYGGSVRIEVIKQNDKSLFKISDTGIGIPKEHKSRIFERFYRVDKSHSKLVGGTGLGLSIVKHASIILGAEIELESEKDIGTTVSVYFPLTKTLP